MVIGGLKPDTTYSITVAAYTTKGDGARSKPKLVVTKGAGQYEDELFVGLVTVEEMGLGYYLCIGLATLNGSSLWLCLIDLNHRLYK